jgi:cyclophilin family peptidyl-prolyl cis-trans isomerase
MAKKKQSRKKPVNKILDSIQAPSTPHDVTSTESLQNHNSQTTQLPISRANSQASGPTQVSKVGEFISSLKSNPSRRRPFVAILLAILFITFFAGFNFYFIPYVMSNYTDTALQQRELEEAQTLADQTRAKNQEQLKIEDTVLNFSQNKAWQVELDFAEFGKFRADLNTDFAPKTVESFIRLTYRDYYDDTIFHNMLKDDQAVYLQGGDKENRDGTGGKSAFFIDQSELGLIPDEIWSVPPQRDVVGGITQITNAPELRAPSLYRNLDINTGQVIYPKGTLFLVKENAPDSGRSVFGITLKDSTLAANYTAFGRIIESDLSGLDRILNETTPTQLIQDEAGELVPQDSIEGRPNPEIKIVRIEILSPQI